MIEELSMHTVAVKALLLVCYGMLLSLPVVSNRCGTTYQIIIVISILYFHDLLTSILFPRNDITPVFISISCKLTIHHKIKLYSEVDVNTGCSNASDKEHLCPRLQ